MLLSAVGKLPETSLLHKQRKRVKGGEDESVEARSTPVITAERREQESHTGKVKSNISTYF